MATDHNFKVKKGLDVLGGDVNLGDGFAYKIDGTTVIDSSKNIILGTTGKLVLGSNATTHPHFKYSSPNESRHHTAHGYISFGPTNSTGAHIYTDRDRFYFNKKISLIDNKLISYNDDLQLRREDADANRIVVGDGVTTIHTPRTVITGTGTNSTPSTDHLQLSGYGIIGNRATVYLTNSNANGIIQIGVGGAHNANSKVVISSANTRFNTPITMSGVEVIDSSRNIAAGTISSGAITASDKITINKSLSGDNSQLVINNTAGAALRMGITGSGANEAAHIKTNSGEALEFHIGQASNASTPDITFKADGAGIQIQGQDFVNSSRNITAGTISSGAITSTGTSTFGGVQIGGTTVISSSRNLTNIGTISSGAITATTVKETDGGDGFTEIGSGNFGYFNWGIEIANPNNGYRAIRFAGKKKYFVLEADVLGTNSANHQGFFWGNADGTAILGGSTTGYKTTHQNSTSFHIRAINSNQNQETYNPGFSPSDGAWHHQKIAATPDGYVRIWIDGDLKFEETGYIPSAEGYLGFINYAGTVRYANIRCRTINEDEAQHFSNHIGNADAPYAGDDRFIKIANNTAGKTGTLVTADNGNTWLNADGGKDLWLNWYSLNSPASKADLQVGNGAGGGAILTVDGTNNRVGINDTSPSATLDVNGTVSSGAITSSGVFRSTAASYSANQDVAYMIAGTSSWTGATTNWNTFGIQHRIKTNSGGTPRVTIDSPNGEQFSVDNNGNVIVAGSLYVPQFIYHGGDTNTYIQFTGDRVRIAAGGTVKFDSSNNYQTTAAPNAVSITSSTIISETVEIVFGQSSTSGVSRYEIWSDGGGSDFSLIGKINAQDAASSMSFVDTTFVDTGTINYRVYAVRYGIYSTAATTSVSFSQPSLDVTSFSAIADLNNFYLQYEKPDTRFLDHIEIYVDVDASSSNLARSGASLIYSGDNSSYMYTISASDRNNFHQFWVECVGV